MDQIYWVSNPTVVGTDTRQLVYRYGRFCYAGSVITEPIFGLEYLPGVLQGIQAVQGQIPYLSEHKDLQPWSPPQTALAYLERAMTMIYNEVSVHEETLAMLAKKGNAWLDDDDAHVYFEFETLPGYTCNGSDVVFAKTFRGEVMMSVLWYGVGAGPNGGGSFFVTLSPAGEGEQALVDTAFPQIYGKRRGVEVHGYGGGRYLPEHDREYVSRASANGGTGCADLAEDGKEAEEGGGGLLDPSSLFTRLSVWEASDEVPDPDEIRARAEAALDLEADGAGDLSGVDGEEEEAGLMAGEDGVVDSGPVVDVSGGEGYTQVYAVMQPAPKGSRTVLGDGVALVPRQAAFRFGSWVYAGQVDFPVDRLRLGDVPYVLPAVQKQQGRLGFLAEANAVPEGQPMTGVLQAFMGAVQVLKGEMEDCQEEVAALAEQSVNAWIDEEWAASFFELSFVPATVAGMPAEGTNAGTGLAGAEVIAAKVYLYGGTGVVLHCVWFGSSLYCVLADSVEDLPLLDVAFPDVTARNRVVQVRAYEERTAKKLAAAFPGCPQPKALRVWEGRRKGVPGVGLGAGAAMAAGSDQAEEIRRKAAERAARETSGGAAGASDSKTAGGAGTAAADVKAADGGDEDEDVYDFGGVKQSLKAVAAGTATAGGAKPAGSGSAAGASGAAAGASSMPSQLMHSSASLARAPHHVAPMNRGGPSSFGRPGVTGPGVSGEDGAPSGNRLIMVGGSGAGAGAGAGTAAAAVVVGGSGGDNSNSKAADAPWDASGRPRGR